MKILKALKILSKKFYLTIYLLSEMFSLKEIISKVTKYSDYKPYVIEIKNDGHSERYYECWISNWTNEYKWN